MKHFKKLLWASLAKHKIASIWRWAFLNSTFERYINDNLNIKIDVYWKVQYDVYFVKLSNSILSNRLFLHKKDIQKYMNQKLEDMSFKRIRDIKFI